MHSRWHHRMFFVGIILTLVSWVLPARGQASVAPPPNLLRSSLAALITTNTGLQDITMTGTVEYHAGSTDETGSITLSALPNGSSRMDLTLPSRTSTESVSMADSKLSGQTRDPKGKLHATAFHNLLTESVWFCPAIIVAHYVAYSQKGEVSSQGTEFRNGLTVIHLTSSRHVSTGSILADGGLKRLSKTDLLIDPITSLPSSLTYAQHPDANARIDSVIEIRYSDYASFQGILIPTHIQRYINGVLGSDINITSTTVNTGITETQFHLN